MSYKVLIVDDEKWIYDLLLRIVDWESFGFQISGYASNGLDAFQFICTEKPDLVVSDIRIPEIDGIELVKRVRAENLAVRFILISGYQEFEYAQDALKYNVDDYLLKPIEEEEIESILIKIANELRNEDSSRQEIQKMALRLDDSIKQLRLRTFEKLLYSDSPVRVELEELNQYCEMKLKPGYFQVVLISLDIKTRMNDSISSLFYSKIEKMLRDYITPPAVLEYAILPMNDFLVLITNHDDVAEASNYYKSVFTKVSQLVNAYDRMTITLAVGDDTEAIQEIYQSFSSAKARLYFRAVFGGNRIIEKRSVPHSRMRADNILTSKNKAELLNAFQVLDEEKVTSILEEIFNAVSSIHDISPQVVKNVLAQVLKQLENSLEYVDAGANETFHSFTLEDKLLQCNGIKDLFGDLKSFVLSTMRDISERQKSKLSKPVERAKRYVKDFYYKPLSLSEIAKNVFLSEQYLSELFKRETGRTITDYIREYKIEMAKMFMNDTRYKITDIAEKVGYNDARHFSKIFKKLVGVTPKEYRRLGV